MGGGGGGDDYVEKMERGYDYIENRGGGLHILGAFLKGRG